MFKFNGLLFTLVQKQITLVFVIKIKYIVFRIVIYIRVTDYPKKKKKGTVGTWIERCGWDGGISDE